MDAQWPEGATPLTLYLDLDGVLADFDAGAERAIGTTNTYKWEWIHGPAAFWTALNADPNFFYHLPMTRDADVLWGAVAHLHPTILTALPKRDSASVDQQKRAWVAEKLGTDVPVITCLTSEKPAYCLPGDILVDDRAVNAAAWANKMGNFVLHVGAHTSINTLRQLGII
ncbi:hypothetical protein SAMN02983003_0634 [Devosia enhydra]|uniref:5' nucleotidase, deoxy (Pyrimidine), type C protein (NT5C) n=1 Tax=Devosia enhydra TaxID=665118 RepID=A0A1K2HU58_9HYPH|nr:hypothetical protein [Devosia enhydra]SFZ81686.1 hypothetical protein SAMN02983003_0634 [Devosia enhydra]